MADICKSCKYWIINDNELFHLAGMLDERGDNIRTEKELRQKMKFGIRLCKHPKIVSNQGQGIQRDSVIMNYDDYHSYQSFFTCEAFGCMHYEKKPLPF